MNPHKCQPEPKAKVTTTSGNSKHSKYKRKKSTFCCSDVSEKILCLFDTIPPCMRSKHLSQHFHGSRSASHLPFLAPTQNRFRAERGLVGPPVSLKRIMAWLLVSITNPGNYTSQVEVHEHTAKTRLYKPKMKVMNTQRKTRFYQMVITYFLLCVHHLHLGLCNYQGYLNML